MNLASLLSQDAVLPRLDAASKKQVLRALAERGEALTGIPAADIFDVLMAREQASCTGVGGGSAIPHGRFEELHRIHMLFATLARPVEFGAADGDPVDIIFMLLSPAAASMDHLKAMGVVSRLLRDRRLCDALRRMDNADDIHALLTSRAEAA